MTFQIVILAGLSLLTALGGLITVVCWLAFVPISAPRQMVMTARLTLMLTVFALTAAAAYSLYPAGT